MSREAWERIPASSGSVSVVILVHSSFIYSAKIYWAPTMCWALYFVHERNQIWKLANTTPTPPYVHRPTPCQTTQGREKAQKEPSPSSEAGGQRTEPLVQLILGAVAARKGRSVQVLRNCAIWRGMEQMSLPLPLPQSQPCMHLGGTSQDTRAKQIGTHCGWGIWGLKQRNL